jgi:transposase
VSTLDHKLEPEVTPVRRLEVITGAGRRRRFTEDFKARVVEETLAPGAVVSEVARRHDLTPASVHVASASAQGSAAADRERSPDVRAGRCGNGIAIPASTQKAAPADAPGGSDLRKHRGGDRRCDRADWLWRGHQDDRGGAASLEGQHVIGLSGTVRVLVATKPVDFRKGAEGLAALVREQMQSDPFSGAVYVFRAKRADRVKLIYWDGTGVCLFAKRLEDGKFRWPSVQDGVMRLSPAELSALLEGLDWKRVHAAREIPAPVQPG